MSTTAVSAGQLMDRVANLLNDPSKTDYTYTVMLPYLNMAIEQFSDLMAEANSPLTNMTSYHYSFTPIVMKAGQNYIVFPEYEQAGVPSDHWARLPPEIIEIQEVSERPWVPREIKPELQAESSKYGTYIRLPRREFVDPSPPTNSLQYWVWQNSIIRTNPANIDMEIAIKYIYQGVPYVTSESTVINMIGSRTYLAYKTAALCAMFIGENETRARVLEDEANKAADVAIAIGNKGRQQIMTRHRPFRAAYKMRGGW